MTRTYVGLGSNLDDPEKQIQMALRALAALPQTTLIRHSALYRSPPMGPQDQPDYINAVALLETDLPARELLHCMLEIERRQGRVRTGKRWGPRTLDLDLLVYGEERWSDELLTVPHPEIPNRAFVLYPLSELAPDLNIPGFGPLAELLKACPAEGLRRCHGNG
ncbi:MAG: 2-amino-4-hydroxy-6-hydroxymethyldihydropteridine diphosphokinase [Gammaproteobacteria bacterium]|nr:2-amino-4-hydroxy-6-hydroxymethyldihydropteridine diphosphokinase [Gammaproteobacteria bacterium]MCI0591309.1 2-amino-4-hydroxy-6-hydroxymethyldihydropteridine diphosphokinase [Gammaproteobacteria bacterium]